MRIVLVEDRKPALDLMRPRLMEQGIGVDAMTSLREGLVQSITSSDVDALVISLPLTRGTGPSLITAVRNQGYTGPIIVLQDSPNTDEAVALYGASADDVVQKPIKAPHLAARIRSILRRMHGYVRAETVIGDLVFPLDGRPPSFAGEDLPLSRRERALLECLVMKTGKAVSRDTIFATIYGAFGDERDPKIIDVYVCKLRKKLKNQYGDYIETVFGIGYMLADPARHVEKEAAVA